MDEEIFQRLCQAQIEGVATEEERAHLAEMLDSSDEARRLYVQQMRVHAFLSWQHGRAVVALPEIEAAAKIVPFPKIRWMAAAAAVLIFAGLAAWWRWSGEGRSGVSLEVVAASASTFRVGERITRRSLEMERGTLSFRLGSGALVDVSGPAKVELISAMRLRVLHGTVTADISEGTKGFVIETAQAQVVDLGTRFSVSAESSARTDVVVFEGKVEVFDPSGKATARQPKVTLTEGEAVRLDRSSPAKPLRMVALGADAQSLEGGRPSDLVTDVQDNVSENGFRGYYGLIRGALAEGARAYTTGHTRTWHPMPGGVFPKELEGADGICTFGEDRTAAGLQITLRVSQPCDLYVMADARFPAPEWLQRDFSDTGLRLRCGPWIARNSTPAEIAHAYTDEKAYVPHTVWKMRVGEPGVLTLGSPIADGVRGKPAMYGLAVKAIP